MAQPVMPEPGAPPIRTARSWRSRGWGAVAVPTESLAGDLAMPPIDPSIDAASSGIKHFLVRRFARASAP